MRKFLVLTAVFVLLVTGASPGAAATASRSAGGSSNRAITTSARDYYLNLVAPRAISDTSQDSKVDASGRRQSSAGGASSSLEAWWAATSKKHSGGFPQAAKQLGKDEAKAAKTGKNPREFKQADETQTARLLTVLVEFNPTANDDFSGWERQVSIDDPTCVTEPAGTLLSGPAHGLLPNPATVGQGTDNNTFWVPNFDAKHYRDMIYTTTGLQARVRPDLKGPDGKKGIDLRGYTMKNMYREMSKGAYDITGDVAGWIMLPHSEAWYAADSCVAGNASNTGHPDNSRGVAQMIVDAVDDIAASDPSFPWASYDVEDQGDLDGDGDLLEPDGVIDHFVIVHAGVGEEGGGGDQGTYAVWSHASVVDPSTGGYQIPGTDTKVFNYIAQPEDAGVGVFAHEYGHDLGLPDLYDTSGAGESDVEFWDLMSTGSHSGPIFQGIPAHMGLWDKFVLGWADPKIFAVGAKSKDVTVGQTSRTPKHTEDGVRVNLPTKEINLATAHSGTEMWYSNNDQSWADVKLARTIDVPAGTDVRFELWNNYVAEELWDYGFIEISTDGGTTWSQQVVKDNTTDAVVSTNDDPNGRLNDYGGLVNGLTGDSGGWRNDYVDLTPYAGQTIGLRLRYATDAAFEERGWFADDFSVSTDGTTVWSDDVEGGMDGWTAALGTFAGTAGAGWVISTGLFSFGQYYLAEWRNFDGFDLGLKYTYDSDYLRFDTGEWSVQRVAYNAPGMLVWYRNLQYSVNHTTVPLTALPSTGSKGMLLLVDSHFDPLRRTGKAAAEDPSTLNNIQSRPQSSNAAFGTRKTYPFKECLESPDLSYDLFCTKFKAQKGVATFTDRKGWYPGLENRDEGLFFRDIDASVVIPSVGNQQYTTRIVDKNGKLIKDLYGLDLGDGIILGTGNPADGNMALDDPDDLSMGVSFSIKSVAKDNMSVKIHVNPAD